jgi:hypothetical protein
MANNQFYNFGLTRSGIGDRTHKSTTLEARVRTITTLEARARTITTLEARARTITTSRQHKYYSINDNMFLKNNELH